MSKFRESSTDKAPPAGGLPEPDQKRKWVNLAQLDGPLDDALADRLAYKPALRFHGLTGGLWGQGISGAPSILSERPPSYNAVDPLSPRDAYSTSDQGSVFNSIPAISRLKLRRRNTLAVVVVAIGLLAAVAAISGLVLHFLHPKGIC
ncbi:hypothetical protein MAR_013486 [Mya arenaria]|uniref:Uncharacterized protein n=1 Tax=Mya arenaria TaxID=6604 RepID=A0ABY7G1J6_MYAAR|nr:hypothetical protein MAR_013486 [Mya arenaria]